jgi:hypothetical protein
MLNPYVINTNTMQFIAQVLVNATIYIIAFFDS